MSLPLRRLGFFSFCALFLAVILSTLATVSAQSAPDSSTPESSFASQNPRGTPALADADGFQETSRRRLRRPHISEVKPDKAHQGQTNLNVAVTGQYTHFVQGTTTASFGTGITINSVTVRDRTHVTVNVSIDAAARLGVRDIVLKTNAEVVVAVRAFWIFPGIPALTQVSPNSGHQGQSNLNVAITGQYTHFVKGMTTASFGIGITVNSVTVIDATHARVSVSIAAAATVGARNVTLKTRSEVVVAQAAFTVTSTGTPVITQVNPNTGQQGQSNLNVAVSGQYTHFVQGTTTASFGAGITLNSVTVADSTHVTVNLSVDAMATLGNRNVTLTTGSEVVTLSNGFAVGAGTPVITQVNPNTAQQGQSTQP